MSGALLDHRTRPSFKLGCRVPWLSAWGSFDHINLSWGPLRLIVRESLNCLVISFLCWVIGSEGLIMNPWLFQMAKQSISGWCWYNYIISSPVSLSFIHECFTTSWIRRKRPSKEILSVFLLFFLLKSLFSFIRITFVLIGREKIRCWSVLPIVFMSRL